MHEIMRPTDKPLVWLHGEVKTPPVFISSTAGGGVLATETAARGNAFAPPLTAMPASGPHCHELRINDTTGTWRIIYRIDSDAIVIVEVFEKKTPQTPRRVTELCQQRLRRYDTLSN